MVSKTLFILAAVCFSAGNALKCYQCQGLNSNEKCMEMAKDSTEIEAVKCEDKQYTDYGFPTDFQPDFEIFSTKSDIKSNNVHKCVKVYSTDAFVNSNNTKLIMRSCVYAAPEDLEKYCNIAQNRKDTTCKLCTDDLCNSSSNIIPSICFLLAIFVASKLF